MRHGITMVLLLQYCHGSTGVFGGAVTVNMTSGPEALTLPIVFDVMLGPAVRPGLAAAEMLGVGYWLCGGCATDNSFIWCGVPVVPWYL